MIPRLSTLRLAWYWCLVWSCLWISVITKTTTYFTFGLWMYILLASSTFFSVILSKWTGCWASSLDGLVTMAMLVRLHSVLKFANVTSAIGKEMLLECRYIWSYEIIHLNNIYLFKYSSCAEGFRRNRISHNSVYENNHKKQYWKKNMDKTCSVYNAIYCWVAHAILPGLQRCSIIVGQELTGNQSNLESEKLRVRECKTFI